MPTITNTPGQITPVQPAAGGAAATVATVPAGQVAPVQAGRGGGATIAFMAAVGAKQGQIKGDVTVTGREGTIALLSVAHEIDAPFDLASGKLSGRRQHKPITISKAIDQATPSLLQALVTNEVLTSVVITFYRIGADGKEVSYFVIKLTNAALTSYALAPSETDDSSETETLELIYQKITWEYPPGGKVALDDWAVLS